MFSSATERRPEGRTVLVAHFNHLNRALASFFYFVVLFCFFYFQFAPNSTVFRQTASRRALIEFRWVQSIKTCEIAVLFFFDSFPSQLIQWLWIRQVNPGSKAALQGIREGDVITSMNGQSTDQVTNSQAHALLKEAGPTLRLGLKQLSLFNFLNRKVVDQIRVY